MTALSRILMIATSAKSMTSTDQPTGLWLEELTTPYYAFRDAGFDVSIASVAGGSVPVDPHSVEEAGKN